MEYDYYYTKTLRCFIRREMKKFMVWKRKNEPQSLYEDIIFKCNNNSQRRIGLRPIRRRTLKRLKGS